MLTLTEGVIHFRDRSGVMHEAGRAIGMALNEAANAVEKLGNAARDASFAATSFSVNLNMSKWQYNLLRSGPRRLLALRQQLKRKGRPGWKKIR